MVTEITVEEWVRPERVPQEGPAPATRIGIAGLGLIGGSLARRLAAARCEVIAWNHHEEPYTDARRYGIQCVPTVQDLAAAKPDILVLCTPLAAMAQVLADIAPVLDPTHTTLTDVGSVKGIMRDQVRAAGLDDCYVGAHPMAGNELSGWKAADPHLFHNALWAVTFDDTTNYGRVLQVSDMITQTCRNRLIIIDDETHDRATAQISHLPHAVATQFANMLIDNPDRNIAMALAAGSWRDMTRVALTDPKRTEAMVQENAENVETLLRSMAASLTQLADELHTNDQQAIDEFFAHADPFRSYRARQLQAIEEENTETVFDSLTVDATDWRNSLLRSAQRGEYIIRFTDPHRAITERLTAL